MLAQCATDAGQLDNDAALIIGITRTRDETLFFEAPEQGRQRVRIEVQPATEVVDNT